MIPFQLPFELEEIDLVMMRKLYLEEVAKYTEI
jgi:hypothetical protein